jgi:integrase
LLKLSPKQSKSDWESTGIQNLIRYRPSGTYFARFKIGRKPFRKTLDTQKFTTAKLRLPDKLREYRSKVEAERAFRKGKMTFSQTMQIYLESVEADASLKPSSKHYRRLLSKFIVRTWPELKTADIRAIKERDCQKWLLKFQQRYAPSVVNNSIGTMKAIFKAAVDAGARFDNPASNLKRVKIRAKQLQLPSTEEFGRFVEAIATAGAPQSRDCATLVNFLAYTGMRISEAGFVTWRDVDFNRKHILVRGDPATATKNDQVRSVPFVPQLETMLREMRKHRATEGPAVCLMRVKECQKSMDRAAKIVGMHRITHHDLRHLFATVSIESGVDVPTVSHWLGHKDGGALCMKTYGHHRDAHSQAQAQRVTF